MQTAVYTGSIEQDNLAFAGTDGAGLRDIAKALAGNDTTLAGLLKVRPGVEIRSNTSLTLQNDWNMLAFGGAGQILDRPGGAAMALTLRAQGDLNLTHSLSDGFRNNANGGGTASAAEHSAAVRPDSYIVTGEGASLRLVGGADLGAAKLLQTFTDTTGDVLIGRAGSGSITAPDVLVRSTTGRIDIAAGRDLRLLNREAVVYTTGLPQTTSGITGLTPPPSGLLLSATTGRQSPFLANGGAISLTAGRDLTGGSDSRAQYGTDWWWRNSNASAGTLNWWSRYDQFRQGFATFGGGSLTANAGRDAVGVALSTAGSGTVTASTSNNGSSSSSAIKYGGGDLHWRAGRDLIDGFAFAGGRLASLQAGRDVASSSGQAGLQLLHLDTQIDISARNDMALGRVVAAGLVAPLSRQSNLATNGLLLAGLSPAAALDVMSVAGSLSYSGQAPSDLAKVYAERSPAESVIPSAARFVALQGSLRINGNLIQTPVLGADLVLLAAADLQLSALSVTGSQPALATPSATNSSEWLAPFPRNSLATEQGSRAPVRLVAQTGDLQFDAIQALNPLRLIAARDLTGRLLSVQHQQAGELTLMQAGRDVVLDAITGGADFSVKLQGPGDLMVLAGRDVVLGTSGGFGTVGNLENSALPSGGAAVTIIAGIKLGSAGARDLSLARARYVQLLGGGGLAGRPEHLYAQLAAQALSEPLPLPGSAAETTTATAFAALPAADRLALTTSLLGAERVAALASAFLAERDLAQAAPAQALAALADQRGAVLDSFIGHALAEAWLARVPQAEQPMQAVALAALPAATTRADGLADPRPGYRAALTAFMRGRTGQALDDVQALAAFASLPDEQQLLYMQRVLFDELRFAGRTAAISGGVERELAYERGFSALATLFPGTRTSGSVRLTASQIKTQQGGELRIITPGGGANAGESFTGGTTKPASAVGIVTVAGGNIELAVRDSVIVNQSRVFTVGQGDVLIWASRGDIDAGRGAKTVTGAPPPVYKIDSNGNVVVDTTGSFAGSGIAVLDASSTLDLFAPAGEINAGDAGIQSRGNANLAAERLVGADAISVQGQTTRNQPPPAVNAAAMVAPTVPTVTAAAASLTGQDDDERKKRRRRNLILDFLGFSQGD